MEETLIQLIERRFVTADGVIIWNEQIKGLIENALKNEKVSAASKLDECKPQLALLDKHNFNDNDHLILKSEAKDKILNG